MSSIFDTLTDLPLFKGVTHEVMAKTVGKYPFHFKKYGVGDTIVEAGTQCSSLIFIISGHTKSILKVADILSVTQILPERIVLAPEFLFGLSTEYPATIAAVDETSTLEISKADYLNILGSDHIFLFNCLNLLSRSTQKSIMHFPTILRGKPIRRLETLIDLSVHPLSTDIEITAIEGTLPSALGISEEEYSASLHPLKENGVANYDTHSIFIPRRF